jgi:hypothetical protein
MLFHEDIQIGINQIAQVSVIDTDQGQSVAVLPLNSRYLSTDGPAVI